MSKHPDPIPTPWPEDELVKAHDHRASILLDCTRGSSPSQEMVDALLAAKEAEAKLTKYETLYNNALINLKTIVND